MVADVGLATMSQDAATRRFLAAFAIRMGSATALARVRIPAHVAASCSPQGAVPQLIVSATVNGPHHRGNGRRSVKVLLTHGQRPMV